MARRRPDPTSLSERYPDAGLAGLAESWLTVHLPAERKSSETIRSYRNTVTQFLAWALTNGDADPELTRATVQPFIVHTLDNGGSASTAGSRLNALKQLGAWMVDEGEANENSVASLKAPRVDEDLVDPLTDDELRALFKACEGKAFMDRRDMALVRLLANSGVRAGEAVDMGMEDIALSEGRARVRRGKGGKERIVGFDAKTGQAIDRYVRVRKTHPLASRSDKLWLGANGQGFGYQALWKALGARALAAGITEFHPHRLRHTHADRWLTAGGSEQALMAHAGWTKPDMLMRYTKARASVRALEESKRLNLGEL